MLEFALKSGITALLVFVLVSLWRKDVDIVRTFSPTRIFTGVADNATAFLVERNPSLLYQDGKEVAEVFDPTIDETKNSVSFVEIRKSELLDRSRSFEFRKLVLKFSSADSIDLITSPRQQQGQIIKGVKCIIIGSR